MLKLARAAWLGCALVLGFGLFTVPQTSFAASEDVPVTDADTLEALGFSRDAKNVYRAPLVDLDGAFSDHLSLAPDLDAQVNAFAPGSTDYATAWARELAAELNATGAEWQYGSRYNQYDLYFVGKASRWAEARVTDLPNGGVLDWYRAWWFDDDDRVESLVLVFVEVCQPPYSGGTPRVTVLANLVPTTSNGEESGLVSLGARAINTRDCMYIARVSLAPSPDRRVAFHKVRIQFRHP